MLQINKEDGLPDQVCFNCSIKMKEYANFKEKCRKNDLHLKKLLRNAQTIKKDCLNTTSIRDNNNINIGNLVVLKSQEYKCEKIIKSENIKVESTLCLEPTIEVCKLCGQTLNDISQNEHDQQFHNDERHKCSVCKKEYKDAKSLKKHIRVHKY